MNKRFTMIGSAYLLLFRDEKILLSRRFQTGYEDGKYSLPAGHVEDGETLTEALVREVKEEIGIDADHSAVQLVHIMHRKQDDIRVDYFFTVVKYSGTIGNREPEKCDDLSWHPVDALPRNTIPYIRAAIEYVRNGVLYSEFGWKREQ